MVIHFKYGFIYKEVQYGWNNKKLYRLPYVKNNKSYAFKEIPFYCFKTTAKIQINGKQKHLGYFNTEIEAYERYISEKEKMHSL